MEKKKRKIILIAETIVIILIEVARNIICDRLPKGDVVFWSKNKSDRNEK